MNGKIVKGTPVVHSWAQIIHHAKCEMCKEPYDDNSRVSKVCKACRPEYDRMMHRERQRAKKKAQ